MNTFTRTGDKLTIEDIKAFEAKHEVEFTKLYTKFLLENNGGHPEKSVFRISDEQGESVLSILFGIGGMDYNLDDVLRIMKYDLPDEFIPVATDPAGNKICLGIKGEFYEHIYFWDHEQGPDDDDDDDDYDDDDDEPDMSNMYYLAPDIFQFVESLYSDE